MEKLKARVMKCFQAASDSSGCRMKVEEEMVYADLVNNLPLAREYHMYMEKMMGIAVPMDGPTLGSTDFVSDLSPVDLYLTFFSDGADWTG
jgi:metal-dependent amidase/aminoacylase/carboxypeptidase family protein